MSILGGTIPGTKAYSKEKKGLSISSDSSGPANIKRVTIYSNKDNNTVELAGGVILLQYWESILQDSIRASVVYGDSGNTLGKDNKKVNAREGLPIVGSETVDLKFDDNNDNSLDLKLYVNKVTELVEDSTKSMIRLDLGSMETFMNEKVRIKTRLDGKISEHVKKILQDDEEYLSTEKDVEIEETANNLNFIGNNKKPFWTLNWLSKKSVPMSSGKEQSANTLGKTAGFIFYETADKYYFRSIDSLMGQEKQLSVIYTESPDNKGVAVPKGYDVKALTYSNDNRVNVQNKMMHGAYEKRIVLFDPFNCDYQKQEDDAESIESESGIETAGEELPKLNPAFKREGDKENFTMTSFCLKDPGTLPTGGGEGKEQEQLEKSKEENFQPGEIVNQSVMRLNQLFASMVSITIPGYFSLRAGDAIFVDSPQLESTTGVCADQPDKLTGGKYIIADLCHYLTKDETYTKLNLIRDSVGRKGKPT